MTAENAASLRRALSERNQQPDFLVSDPPSARANDGLISDLRAEGAVSSKACTVEAAVNPNDKSCWDGLSAVVRYDAKKVQRCSVSQPLPTSPTNNPRSLPKPSPP